MQHNLGITIIRGEPERAPNTRVTFSKFAVPMYVCMYVSMYVAIRRPRARMRACSIARPVKIVIILTTVQYLTGAGDRERGVQSIINHAVPMEYSRGEY